MDAGIAGILGAVIGAAITGAFTLYLHSKDRGRERRAQVSAVYLEFLGCMRDVVETRGRLHAMTHSTKELNAEVNALSESEAPRVKNLERIQAEFADLRARTAELDATASQQEKEGRAVLDRLMLVAEPRMVDPIQRLLKAVQDFQHEPTLEKRAAYSDSERTFLLAARAE